MSLATINQKMNGSFVAFFRTSKPQNGKGAFVRGKRFGPKSIEPDGDGDVTERSKIVQEFIPSPDCHFAYGGVMVSNEPHGRGLFYEDEFAIFTGQRSLYCVVYM